MLPGSVAYVSRCSGLTTELADTISETTNGQFEGVVLSEDDHTGTSLLDHLLSYQDKPQVVMLVLLGEVTGNEEFLVCEAIKEGKISKPIVALCYGNIADRSAIFQFGDTATGAAEEAAAAKNIAFTQAGAIVPDSFDDIGTKIKAEFHKLIFGQKGVKVRDMMNRYDLNISVLAQEGLSQRVAELEKEKEDHIQKILSPNDSGMRVEANPTTALMDHDYGLGTASCGKSVEAGPDTAASGGHRTPGHRIVSSPGRFRVKKQKDASIFEVKPKVKRLEYSQKTTKSKATQFPERGRGQSTKAVQFPERGRKNSYTEKEKRFSIRLMFTCPKSYRIVKASGFFSRLPHESTIRGWIQFFKCRPGHNSHLMKLLHYKKLMCKDKKDNYVVLMLDGMHTKNETKYCASLGELVNGANEVEVVLIRGLFRNWKHVCHFDFDQRMNLEKLKTIITNVQESGLIVKVVVMDMGNHRLQSDLHIANMEYTFDNPSVKGESILIMPDPIHGLKNLRNAIIEHGAVIHWRGKSVPLDKKHFQQVILEHSKPGEACILYKIDIKQHLELTNQEKQRVDKAFQLLSRRMANAFRLSGLEDQAEVISCINDFFDVLNSRKSFHFNELKCGFGMNIDAQVKAIENMRELLLGLKVNPSGSRKRHAMMPFQRGLLIDIKSVLHLNQELNLNPDNYLLLSKVCIFL